MRSLRSKLSFMLLVSGVAFAAGPQIVTRELDSEGRPLKLLELATQDGKETAKLSIWSEGRLKTNISKWVDGQPSELRLLDRTGPVQTMTIFRVARHKAATAKGEPAEKFGTPLGEDAFVEQEVVRNDAQAESHVFYRRNGKGEFTLLRTEARPHKPTP